MPSTSGITLLFTAPGAENRWAPPISADAAAAMKDVIVKALSLTLLVVGVNEPLCIDGWYI
jgi:multisubunit Na+/H+ antiporter MnhC subunit